MIKNQSVLITGGTGSFGKAFVSKIINSRIKVKRLVIFSRDELKQSEMAEMYPKKKYPFIRFFLGDVRDQKRLHTAMQKIDLVIHAAALKHVDVAEYNDNVVRSNIALLGFKSASNGSLAKFDLQDQLVDEFIDNSGVDTGASTNANVGSGVVSSGAPGNYFGDGSDGDVTISGNTTF